MRSTGRFGVGVTITTAAALIATGTAAGAVEGAPWGHTVARYDMNESAGARTMYDSSGHGLNGSIGSEVETGLAAGTATGYRFERLEPDTPPSHPRHLATVPSAGDLNPGDRDFSVTVRLRTQYHFGNIVQKGQATVDGGNFKLQIPNGIVQCLFRGSRGSLIVSTKSKLNDGQWHVVRCDRTAQGLAVSVDGKAESRKDGPTGYIANGWPLSVGGKTSCDQVEVGCDYYAGDLDYIALEAE